MEENINKIIFISLLILAQFSVLSAQIDENTLKAIFLKKFIMFVDDWHDDDSIFVVTFVGNTPILDKFKSITKDNSTIFNKIKILQVIKITDIDTNSNIIFLIKRAKRF